MRISVIVPVYNAERYLDECIDSILSQTYADLEIILVDDGSTDNSGMVCDAYARQDDRVHVLHFTNVGAAEARLKGFNASTGELIVFVDADDFLAPEMLETMYNAMQQHQADVVGCQYYYYSGDKKTKSSVRPHAGMYNKDSLRELLESCAIHNITNSSCGVNPFYWSKLYQRKFVGKMLLAGQGLAYGEDLVSILALYQEIDFLYIVDQYLYFYRRHPNQVTSLLNEPLWYKFIDHVKCLQKQYPMDVFRQQINARSYTMLCDLVNKAIENGYDEEYLQQHVEEYLAELPDTFSFNPMRLSFKGRIKYFLLRHRIFVACALYAKIKHIFVTGGTFIMNGLTMD